MKATKILFFFLFASFSISTVSAQTADEIIKKHVDAIGGAENWKKVKSIIQTGSMTVQGADVSIVRSVAHGQGARSEISLMGMTGYEIVTPTEGWNFMPFNGQTKAEPKTADDVKEGQEDLDAQGSLVDYAAKGHTVELLGKEDVDGTECFKVKVTYKSGRTETLFFDPTSFYLVKSISVKKANGQEMELTTTYSNYQKLPEGIVVPMGMSIPLGPGFSADMTVTKVEVNKTIDPSAFKPSN